MTWTQTKIPAQQRWLEPQVTCSLGRCHGSHTLTDVRKTANVASFIINSQMCRFYYWSIIVICIFLLWLLLISCLQSSKVKIKLFIAVKMLLITSSGLNGYSWFLLLHYFYHMLVLCVCIFLVWIFIYVFGFLTTVTLP